MKALLVSLLLAASLCGCTRGLDRKIDGSSEERYRESISKIKQEASPEEAKQFDDAVMVVAMSQVFGDTASGNGLLGAIAKLASSTAPDQFSKQVMAQLDGKTGKQVIALAKEKRRDRARKELESVNSEVADLQRAKAKHEAAKEVLGKIQVTDPRYYFSSAGFLPTAVLDFSVKNGTAVPLRRLYFHGVVSTPGRSVPWVSDYFNYEVAGGLEPGESKHLRLEPNMFLGKWNSQELRGRNDLVFTVDVLDAENAAGDKLGGGFSATDAERLATLQQQKSQLEREAAGS